MKILFGCRWSILLIGSIGSGGRVSLAIHRCRKPTIAAIQGPAVGVS